VHVRRTAAQRKGDAREGRKHERAKECVGAHKHPRRRIPRGTDGAVFERSNTAVLARNVQDGVDVHAFNQLLSASQHSFTAVTAAAAWRPEQ